MKKKVAIASLMSILVLVSMFLCLFYTPLSDEEIAQDGKRIYYPQIPYYNFLDECEGALYDNLSVSEEDKKPKST